MRRLFTITAASMLALVIGVGYFWQPILWSLVVLVPLIALGVVDMTQRRQAIRRNFPLIGHGRYLLEHIRPEVNQYFIESNNDGKPFSRNDRSIVYQRAKGALDTLPFGTQRDVYAVTSGSITRLRRFRRMKPHSGLLLVAMTAGNPTPHRSSIYRG
jgi:glutamate synthase domain-containing protein 2